MIQERSPLLAHALLLGAVAAGIVGMGTVFDASVNGNLRELAIGIPVLLIGLWWAGHELGRSMIVSRAHKRARGPGASSDEFSGHGSARG